MAAKQADAQEVMATHSPSVVRALGAIVNVAADDLGAVGVFFDLEVFQRLRRAFGVVRKLRAEKERNLLGAVNLGTEIIRACEKNTGTRRLLLPENKVF